MIKKFHPFDLSLIELQEAQQATNRFLNDLDFMRLTGDSFTFIEDGEFTACFGMESIWRGRAQVWAHIGNVKSWVKLTRTLKKLIAKYAELNKLVRLELITEQGFEQSERWARMLGFKKESVMKNYGIDGRDNTMWVMLWIR